MYIIVPNELKHGKNSNFKCVFGYSQGATDMIIGIGIGRYIGIGRFIGKADMGNAYRYRLSVSADKKAHIGMVFHFLSPHYVYIVQC